MNQVVLGRLSYSSGVNEIPSLYIAPLHRSYISIIYSAGEFTSQTQETLQHWDD